MTARTRRSSLAVILALTVALIGATVARADGLHVVASGLSNPRGLDVSASGALYVSEAGKGGPGPCQVGPDGEQSCFGKTGAIARVNPWTGDVRRVVAGLPSLAPPPGAPDAGADATGPQDVSINPFGLYFTVGLGGDPTKRDVYGSEGHKLGLLYRLSRFHGVRPVADIAGFEAANDPDKGLPDAEVDSNPYSVDASNPFDILVTDAGGNDLVRVGLGGRVRLRAVFPFGQTEAPPFLGLPPGTKIPYQSVPTGVVRAPGRGAYVAQLTGFPFPKGAANVFKVGLRGDPTVAASGFTTAVDVGLGRRGSIYVLQIASDSLVGDPGPGRLFRVDRDGTRTELAAGQLQNPTGMAVGRHGNIYVANNGGSPTDGQIVRIHDGH